MSPYAPEAAEALVEAGFVVAMPEHFADNDKDDSDVWSSGIAMTDLIDNRPKAYSGNSVEFIRGIERVDVRF